MLRLGEKDALIKTRIRDVKKLAPATTADTDAYKDTERDGWPRAEHLIDQASFYSICDPIKKEGRLNAGKPSEISVHTPYSFLTNIDIEVVDLC